jgi:hypothetical protein
MTKEHASVCRTWPDAPRNRFLADYEACRPLATFRPQSGTTRDRARFESQSINNPSILLAHRRSPLAGTDSPLGCLLLTPQTSFLPNRGGSQRASPLIRECPRPHLRRQIRRSRRSRVERTWVMPRSPQRALVVRRSPRRLHFRSRKRPNRRNCRWKCQNVSQPGVSTGVPSRCCEAKEEKFAAARTVGRFRGGPGTRLMYGVGGTTCKVSESSSSDESDSVTRSGMSSSVSVCTTGVSWSSESESPAARMQFSSWGNPIADAW